ncbi:unnamed protein product [Cylindrotheca closterium]|uniref:ShKT domain-containing protein n=1 Tax=Cylindrotheca closterium TaxID=2856 RepID=A0AAD2JMM2_9STRA|nr:unnamed protein product [Cylindrotheca closterium]
MSPMSLLFQFLLVSSIATNSSSTMMMMMVQAQECAPNGVCDTHPRCSVWKEEGECKKSAGYMQRYCPVSCGYANTPKHTAAELLEQSIQFGVKQEATGESKELTLGVIVKTIEYMKEPRDVHFCKNKHEFCSFWATVGECDGNPGWMQANCGPACGNCK